MLAILGGTTDNYYYTYEGLRYRATLAGTTYRYLYNGERVLEELNDSGTMQARYTTESDSYFGMWLHLYRPTGTLSRFPMGACPERSRGDNIGTARGLVDASGTATDWYELDTFGRQVSSSGTTPNPYRYGGAWGYITDPSGLLQLGARFYWPELGRFVSQDPVRSDTAHYLYGSNNPVLSVDPDGNRVVCRPWATVTVGDEWVFKGPDCGRGCTARDGSPGRMVRLWYQHIITSIALLRCRNTCTGETWTEALPPRTKIFDWVSPPRCIPIRILERLGWCGYYPPPPPNV